jgi:hypothetical protein
MDDNQKISIVNQIIDLISTANKESLPVMVGTLIEAQGINGFKLAEIGHPVFEFKDRYIIYLERNDEKLFVEVPYYKQSLFKKINFNK